jgi:hypothetical protein
VVSPIPDARGVDDMSTKLLADTKYQDLVAKGADNFVADTMRDELWRVV